MSRLTDCERVFWRVSLTGRGKLLRPLIVFQVLFFGLAGIRLFLTMSGLPEGRFAFRKGPFAVKIDIQGREFVPGL